ncbi:MAG: putative subtilase-family protease [Thermoleophilia bacterium]|nr:putative subtilase-family protease [Thermoleophilia bacterium]
MLCATGAAVAQLAGVSSHGTAGSGALVFDGTYQRWLVQAPGHASKRLDHATAKLGGGKSGSELPGDWYEVRLGDEVAAADAEAAFGAAGATAVEPVVPRLPYDEPSSHDDPAAVAPRAAAGEPDAIDDGPGSGAPTGDQLRAGPTGAPRIGEQWALSQASDEDLDAPEAWASNTGSGAVVAVIDTGVDATHPDLAGRVLPGRDFSGAGTAATVDKVGHGTQVASIIAGNGTNIAGIAPDARILPLKVFRDSETGFSMSGYLSAIRYAADQGVDVINISLGCGGTTSCFSQAELDALTYATDHGVLVVAAAGNTANDNDSPATPDFPSGYELPGVLAVTASTRFGEWATWSSYGSTSVDLAAPGEGILVASPGGSFRSVTGTSFSAPYASGVAALVAADQPTLTPADLRAKLVASVAPDPSLRNRVASGGVLNAQSALAVPDTAELGGGGAAAAAGPVPASPRSGATVGTPPVLTWSLPEGWTSAQVRLAGMGARYDRTVAATSRAMSHPAAAWRSGTYTWQVVARDPEGGVHTSTARTYRIAPRLGAWVTSGTVRPGGRSVRLRIGYAASEPSANVRVVVASGGRTLHTGRSLRHTSHARGTGSPRRGWFTYDAPLSRALRAGTPITVSVRVTAGGATITRTFRARVA